MLEQLTMQQVRGFTLIELMVVVAVLGVLAAIAMPNMRDFIDRQRLITQAREIANVMQLARSEAIAHSASGAAEAKSIAVTVSPTAPWFVGLANGTAACTYPDTDPLTDCKINQGGEAVPHTVTASRCAGCTMVAPTAQVLLVFNLRGLVTGGGSAEQQITLQSPLGKRLSIRVSRLGRISVCTPNGLVGQSAC